jgi:hypothetical protein
MAGTRMECDEHERLTMRLGKHLQAAGASAVLVFGAGGVLDTAPGKEISTADPKIQEEIILARQGLMEGLYELLNDGESPENSTEATAMQANAEAVAASLPALKFLFPPETSPQSSTVSRNISLRQPTRPMRWPMRPTRHDFPNSPAGSWLSARRVTRRSGRHTNRPWMHPWLARQVRGSDIEEMEETRR